MLNALITLILACNWAKSSKAYFTIRCWIAHVAYWTLYWKWKAESSGVGTEWLRVYPLFTLTMAWLTAREGYCHCPARRVLDCISLVLENSKSDVRFLLKTYCFHATLVKSRNRKLNPKLGTVYISQILSSRADKSDEISRRDKMWISTATMQHNEITAMKCCK